MLGKLITGRNCNEGPNYIKHGREAHERQLDKIR